MKRLPLVWLLMAVSLTGCLGIPPKPKATTLPAELPLSEPVGGGQWPAPDWWNRYQDTDLAKLVALALDNSPSLATAHARFDSAEQSVRIAGADSGAHVQATSDASRQRLSDNGLFPPDLLGFHWYDQFDLGLQATYSFDWWGKQRDAIAAAVDEAHAAQAERAAAALLLESSVADAYFGWQADQLRLTLAHAREKVLLREAQITESRIRAEVDAADAANPTTAGLAEIREQVAALEGSAKLRLIVLAALVGRPGAELPGLTPKPLPTVGMGLPDSVRIDLMARRPDLIASLWRVQAAERNRDAARAEFFPDFSLNALVGLQSRDLGSLLKYNSRVPELGAAVHLPIFDEGRLKARYGAAQAGIESAVASYRDTLVSAARDVATQAATRAELDAERGQRRLEVDAAQRSKLSAAARVRQGLSDPRAELTATETLIEQQDALVQLDAAALSSDIGLQRALGGGYEGERKAP